MPLPPPLFDEPEDEEWLLTYADAITLLMAFFAMLVSFSKIDLPMFEQVMAGIKQEIGMGDEKSTTAEMKKELENAVFEMQAEKVIDVQQDINGITIEMASGAFFRSGTTDLRAEAEPILEKMVKTFSKREFEFFNIQIEGHTDDKPTLNKAYPSNWELSSAMAARIARFFMDLGVHPYRQRVVGLADTRPKFPNRDSLGEPITENQARNRRIFLKLSSMKADERATYQDLMLEARLREEERKRLEAEAARLEAERERLQPVAPDAEPAPATQTGPAN